MGALMAVTTKVIVALGLTFALTTGVAMADSLGVTSEALAKKYNGSAKSLDIDSRIARGKCSGAVKYVCQYSAGGGTSIVATAPNKKSDIEEITIIYASDKEKDVINYISALGVLMATLVPQADIDERGAALTELLRGIRDGSSSTTYLHDIKFSISLPEGLGVWTFISHPPTTNDDASTK